MSKTPPYYKQERKHTCSLAILRMVLKYYGISETEEVLRKKAEKDYGKNFQNLWNTTIAKLSCEYGIKTAISAKWLLFKKNNLEKAIEQFRNSPKQLKVSRYENKKSKKSLPESLPLSYREMFRAIEVGCETNYESLTLNKLKAAFKRDYLIQTSIKVKSLYPEKKSGFHSLLLYEFKNGKIYYHDPSYGESLYCTFQQLKKAMPGPGAFITYKGSVT